MEFYIKKKTKIHGPYSDKQIRGGIKSGKLKSDSLISDSSSGPWSTIGEALKTNPKYEALARPKAKTGNSSAPKSPSLPTTEATLLPDLEIPALTDDAPPIAGTPEPPKAAVNSYWGQQNAAGQTAGQTAGQAANSPQSNPGNSHQARLQSAKTKKTLLIVFGSIACVGILLVTTVILLILLPFLGHQSEIKQCKDKVKEMARHYVRLQEELSKEDEDRREFLLDNYQDRFVKLGDEVREIQDNWSEGEKERFLVWVQTSGEEYGAAFARSRGNY